jgi:hypothetical protein
MAAVLAVARLRASGVSGFFDRRRGLSIGLSAVAAAMLLGGMAVLVSLAPDLDDRLGIDFREYTDAASRWLGGGSFYQPWQLTGPYDVPRDEFRIAHLPVLYPPYVLALLLPFALAPVLAPLWWAIPLAVTGAVVARYRPAPWTWPILTFCVLAGDTIWLTVSGNPALWTTAAVALGTRYGWPAVAALFKPTLAPFALIGGGGRRWWLALGGLVVLSISLAPLWPDYLVALQNLRGADLLYPLKNVPMTLIPVVAWLGRRPPDSSQPVGPRSSVDLAASGL